MPLNCLKSGRPKLSPALIYEIDEIGLFNPYISAVSNCTAHAGSI